MQPFSWKKLRCSSIAQIAKSCVSHIPHHKLCLVVLVLLALFGSVAGCFALHGRWGE